jgi:glycosyltransferase involved in cell wall biosynthesis
LTPRSETPALGGSRSAPSPRSTQVLLSTYNGAAFLQPLLDSVLGQDRVRLSILVRDDGSTDATLSMLERHARAGRLVYYRGPRLGPAASFLDLLGRADPAFDTFAFCDQDDVWLPDKLSRATDHLGQQTAGAPALYCGRLMLVDEALTPLTLTPMPRRGASFENALVENIAAGCTVVLNPAARDLLTRKAPDWLVAHDWWAYLVVSAFGAVHYDAEPKLLYRQHRANAVGASRSVAGNLARRLRKFRRNQAEMAVLNQAREFRRLFAAQLDSRHALVLERFLERRRSLGASIAYAVRPDVFRQAAVDDWIMRILIGLRLM